MDHSKLPKIWHDLAKMDKDGKTTGQRIQFAISRFGKLHAHRDWPRLAGLDWEGEPLRLAAWLSRSLISRRLKDTVHAFYFGLNNPCRGEVATLGIECGALLRAFPGLDAWKAFAASSEDQSLAGITLGDYESELLDDFYQIAYQNEETGLANDAEYPLGLAYCICVIPDAIRAAKWNNKTHHLSGRVEVCAGFHDGDALNLGWLSGDESSIFTLDLRQSC